MLSNVVLIMVMVVPLAVAVLRARGMDVAVFTLNAGGNSLPLMVASVVSGNIGVGTFVAIFLFTTASPVIGVSIAIAYTLGLLICAATASRIHATSARFQAFGLVDLIVATHRVRQPIFVWLPIAAVFILRIMVQLSALALIMAQAVALPPMLALGVATIFAGAYVAIGGYRAATETDLLHAIVIVGLMVLAATGLITLLDTAAVDVTRSFFDFGPYTPMLLVGIFLFLPFSPVLAIDNWQRVATASSAQTAARAFLIGALICGLCYATIAAAALSSGAPDDALAAFRMLMPAVAPWLADILFASAVLSTIDTFMMPLTTTFARQGLSLGRLRALVIALFALVAALALFTGNILANVIAAFNSLAVLLPAVFGAFVLKNPRSDAAIASITIGVLASLVLTTIDVNSAAPLGFLLSAATYWLAHRFVKVSTIWR
jgi:solute:Na+ symporter, SSS family